MQAAAINSFARVLNPHGGAYILSSTDVSQLFNVARHVGRLKLGSKPTQHIYTHTHTCNPRRKSKGWEYPIGVLNVNSYWWIINYTSALNLESLKSFYIKIKRKNSLPWCRYKFISGCELELTFIINWKIIKRSSLTNSLHGKCNLCLDEKICIVKYFKGNLLHTRKEMISEIELNSSYNLTWYIINIKYIQQRLIDLYIFNSIYWNIYPWFF